MAAAEGGNLVRNDWGELIPVVRFTYTGADGQVIPDEATHILVQARVIGREAFRNHPNIVEVICDEDVEKIEQLAFYLCRSLRRVVMRGVKFVEQKAFWGCFALTEVECDKLEIIGNGAFVCCDSLRMINLPSARIVKSQVFAGCRVLTDVKFGNKLEGMGQIAFRECESLERISIPLKDGLITEDKTFQQCDNLNHVDLVRGELHETISAFHFVDWRNDVNDEIGLINQTLLNTPAGWIRRGAVLKSYPGEKAQAIRRWIRSVLLKIVYYQAEHRRLLNEAATTLEVFLPNDIVMKKVLPFLELPSYTFEVNEEEGG